VVLDTGMDPPMRNTPQQHIAQSPVPLVAQQQLAEQLVDTAQTERVVVESDSARPVVEEVIVNEDSVGNDAGVVQLEQLETIVTNIEHNTNDNNVEEETGTITEEPGTTDENVRRSARQNKGRTSRYSEYTYLASNKKVRNRWANRRLADAPRRCERIYHISVKEGLKKYKGKALESILKELTQLVEKKVFSGVHWNSLNHRQRRKIIRSSMFLKEKFDANGLFQKLKSRLVALGNEQDKSIYEDISSPTAATQTVFIIAAIAAAESRHAVTLDIGGAYLNADMIEEVLMLISKELADILVKSNPQFKPYQREDGTIIVRLDKALYGCVESGKLWNMKITKQLISMGYKQNAYEECVFNRTENGVQCTIVLFVDDLKITCVDKSMIDNDVKILKECFQEITVHEGDNHSYLGMNFDYSERFRVKVTMKGYIDDMMSQYNVEGYATSPAAETLFQIDEESPALDAEQLAVFHSRVAKVLYLAKRVRIDCLCATIFLATRILNGTQQDWDKLDRLLRYINATREIGMVLEGSNIATIYAYVDASFGVHYDMKSHTGSLISLGKGAIHAKSNKQRLMTKSSTESELVGLSDTLPMVIWVRNFLLEQGYNVNPAIIYQDNMSTIAMAKKGKSTNERTRHINIRYFFVKDKIESEEVTIEYLQTDEMIADLLTKPLQGEKFRRLRNLALNWDM